MECQSCKAAVEVSPIKRDKDLVCPNCKGRLCRECLIEGKVVPIQSGIVFVISVPNITVIKMHCNQCKGHFSFRPNNVVCPHCGKNDATSC